MSTIESIVITPGEISVRNGQDIQFHAIAHRPDGDTSDVTNTVTWSTDGTLLLTFDEHQRGLAHFAFADRADELNYLLSRDRARNEFVISAQLDNGSSSFKDTASVILDDTYLTVESMEISPTQFDSRSTDPVQLHATALINGIRVDVTDKAEWTSTNPAVVEISATEGKTEFVSTGRATIRARMVRAVAGISAAESAVTVGGT